MTKNRSQVIKSVGIDCLIDTLATLTSRQITIDLHYSSQRDVCFFFFLLVSYVLSSTANSERDLQLYFALHYELL
ncbi:CLUMA_CG013921, isoform A [Clunio marinus]|uniref:CLUMA_CG013921, isoform A n=1 Tax=Clunio marinus TaxID=568069 RepID=A0A1J1IK91_9DIPT|nr:CLUMA_CG013921, isoform A [Clunio marinus]